MTALTWIFTFALIFLVIRTLLALGRVRNALSTQDMDASLQLAVLKENLLENALETNLARLAEFCRERDLNVNPDTYRPLLQKQRKLRSSRELLADDSALYEEQARWIDSLEPIEFQEAREAHSAGDFTLYARYFLEGVLRYYSDEKVLESLGVLENTAHFHSDFPIPVEQVRELSDSYQALCAKRDASTADPAALENLRSEKEAWIQKVRETIP